MIFFKQILLLFSGFFVGLVMIANAEVHDENFTPDAVLRISEGEVKQSCVPIKSIILVNGTSPGPELRFKEGETVWIRVYNDIPEQNLTMHWHGLTMATAPFSDGTPQAAQWPIPPMHYFDYQLHVPIGMAGTYFYHSHVGFQAISCTGPLTVTETGPPPYLYDGERFIFIQDNFPDNDSVIEHALLAHPMAYEKAQTMILVNGRGGGLSSEQEFCNESLSVIDVQPGRKYRIRVVGATSLAFVSFAIEDHPDLKVIEADASYTDMHDISFIQVGPGQRYSFILETKSNPGKQQYIIQLETRDFGPPTRSFVVLNYGNGFNSSTAGPFFPPAEPPLTLPPTDTGYLDYCLCPLPHPAYTAKDVFPTAEEVTRRVNITFHLDVTSDGALIYLINNYTWNEGLVQQPYLVSLYENNGLEWPSMERALKNDGLDPETYAFPADIGEVIEIVVQGTGSANGGMETHPWHAHGAHYWDLGGGDGVYNQTENEAKWAKSPGRPVKRDTTMIYSYQGKTGIGQLMGWRAWRLRITEPGVWMIHCHLLPHMVWGMQTAWVMGNSTEVLGKVPYPEVEGYLTYGGSVYGNATNPAQPIDYFASDVWTKNGGAGGEQ